MRKKSENKLKDFNDLHSERQHTVHLFQSQIKKLPEQSGLKLLFPIRHAVCNLLTSFQKVLQEVHYQSLFINDKQIFLTRLNLGDRFKKIFLCRQPPKFILTVKTHQFLGIRAVIIKPLKGNSTQKSQSLSSIELQGQIQKIMQLLQKSLHKNLISESEGNEQNPDYKYDVYSLESISYYMFSKMLTDEHYSLGQTIHAVNRKFSDKLRLQTSDKADIKWLNEALDQISHTLLQGFNCSRKELISILAFCRQSVEGYFHSIHQQNHANEERSSALESAYYKNEVNELQAMLPETFKQLHRLQTISTSIDTIKSLFMIGLIFKAECSKRLIDDQSKNRCLTLIKTCYSSTIKDKAGMLKKSGYPEEDCAECLHIFNFEEATV